MYRLCAILLSVCFLGLVGCGGDPTRAPVQADPQKEFEEDVRRVKEETTTQLGYVKEKLEEWSKDEKKSSTAIYKRLKMQTDQLQGQLDKLDEATMETWKEANDGIYKTWEAIKQTFENAKIQLDKTEEG